MNDTILQVLRDAAACWANEIETYILHDAVVLSDQDTVEARQFELAAIRDALDSTAKEV